MKIRSMEAKVFYADRQT